jgi:transposase InsO family protein
MLRALVFRAPVEGKRALNRLGSGLRGWDRHDGDPLSGQHFLGLTCTLPGTTYGGQQPESAYPSPIPRSLTCAGGFATYRTSSSVFAHTVARLGARHTFIRAGRPQTNGCVEWVQQTILKESWKPAFAPVSDLQTDRPRARPGTVSALLEHRTGPHRPLDPRPHPRRGPRKGQTAAQEPLTRRHNCC